MSSIKLILKLILLYNHIFILLNTHSIRKVLFFLVGKRSRYHTNYRPRDSFFTRRLIEDVFPRFPHLQDTITTGVAMRKKINNFPKICFALITLLSDTHHPFTIILEKRLTKKMQPL